MIRLADEYGPALTGRAAGAELRDRLERLVESGKAVVLDFDGVEAISPSFADELFGKVPPEMVRDQFVQFVRLREDLAGFARLVAQHRAVLEP